MSEFSDSINGHIEQYRKIGQLFFNIGKWFIEHQEPILNFLNALIIVEKWYSAAEKLVKNHIVFTDRITDDFAQQIINAENVDDIVLSYYQEDNKTNLNKLIYRCEHASQIKPYEELFSQIITSYKLKHYHLACIGLFTITDGLLSYITQQKTSNYKRRLETIKGKIDKHTPLSEFDKRAICIYIAIDNINNSIFSESDFHKDEPDEINRHWTLHGRTSKQFCELDFIKVLLWIDALIILDSFEKNGGQ